MSDRIDASFGASGGRVDHAKRAALRFAVIDFVNCSWFPFYGIIFRKNRASVLDEFGIAALTAILVYVSKD
jgi:hypothetical protein